MPIFQLFYVMKLKTSKKNLDTQYIDENSNPGTKTKLERIFDSPRCMSAGGRRNGDITEIQGISARKIGQDQGRHVKKSRITTVYTVQRSSIKKAAQFMSRKIWQKSS